MLKRTSRCFSVGAFGATPVRRLDVFFSQIDTRNPLTSKDRTVNSFSDEYLRPQVTKEMEQKHGNIARYADASLAKIPDLDSRQEVVLNKYPDGVSHGLIADEENFSANLWDEKFFRKHILKPADSDDDKAMVLDYCLSSFLLGMTVLGTRYFLAPVWWAGQPRFSLFAESNIEVEIGNLGEKECKTVLWRGKPIFIYHRTDRQIKESRDTPLSALKHPETDDERFPNNNRMTVLLGICTHLGCIPFPNEGIYNGYFCPCHGSHYDISGRIRMGPAPLNLEIPPYKWLQENELLYLGK